MAKKHRGPNLRSAPNTSPIPKILRKFPEVCEIFRQIVNSAIQLANLERKDDKQLPEVTKSTFGNALLFAGQDKLRVRDGSKDKMQNLYNGTAVHLVHKGSKKSPDYYNSPFRTINASSEPLAALQRGILQLVRQIYQFSDHIQGGKPGTSPLKMASKFVDSTVIISEDLQNAFGTIDRDFVKKSLETTILQPLITKFSEAGYLLNPEEEIALASLITHLVTAEGILPQGAPTSNTVMNLISDSTIIPEIIRFASDKVVGLEVASFIDDFQVGYKITKLAQKTLTKIRLLVDLLDQLEATKDQGFYIRTVELILAELAAFELVCGDPHEAESISTERDKLAQRLQAHHIWEFMDAGHKVHSMEVKQPQIPVHQQIQFHVQQTIINLGLRVSPTKSQLHLPGMANVVVTGLEIIPNQGLGLPKNKINHSIRFLERIAQGRWQALPKRLLDKLGNPSIQAIDQELRKIYLLFRKTYGELPDKTPNELQHKKALPNETTLKSAYKAAYQTLSSVDTANILGLQNPDPTNYELFAYAA